MTKTKEQIEEWKEYRKSILEAKSKSDDDFEKYITLISSGGLGLTIAYINDIIPIKESVGSWVLFIGWIMLCATLFINLLSHYKSSINNEKTIAEIEELGYEELSKNIDSRNKTIRCLNLISIITVGIGLLLIIIFTIVNFI